MKLLEKILFVLTLSTVCIFSAEPDEQTQIQPQSTAASLDGAPLEIFTKIANFLPAKDFSKLALSCPYLNDSDEYFKSQGIYSRTFFNRLSNGEFTFVYLLENREDLYQDDDLKDYMDEDFRDEPEIKTFLIGLLNAATGQEKKAWQKFESVMERLPKKIQEFLLQKMVNREDLSPEELRVKLEEFEQKGSDIAKNHLNNLVYARWKFFGGDLQKNFDYLEARALRGDKEANNLLNKAAATGGLIFGGPKQLENIEKGIIYLKKKVKEKNDENAKYWLQVALRIKEMALNGYSFKSADPQLNEPLLNGFSRFALHHHVFSPNYRLMNAPSDEAIFAFLQDLEKKGDVRAISSLLRAAYELKLGFKSKHDEAWNFIESYAQKGVVEANDLILYAVVYGKLRFSVEGYAAFLQRKAAEGDSKAIEICQRAEELGWERICFEKRRHVLDINAEKGNKKAQKMLIDAAMKSMYFQAGPNISNNTPHYPCRYAAELGFNRATGLDYLRDQAEKGHPLAQLYLKRKHSGKDSESTTQTLSMSDTSLDWVLYFYNFAMGYELDFEAAAERFDRSTQSH